jgi:hypothetical protein
MKKYNEVLKEWKILKFLLLQVTIKFFKNKLFYVKTRENLEILKNLNVT